MSSIFVKVLAPVLAIVLVLVISRLRGFSWSRDLGLVWPRPKTLLAWLALWCLWMALTEFVLTAMGVAPPNPWTGYTTGVILLRILAIGILGPVAEELVMRGVLFVRLSTTRLGPKFAIVICAALWAAVHVQYDWRTILMIFLDGLIFGYARHRTGSTWVPILMHIMGNLFSIYQSLS